MEDGATLGKVRGLPGVFLGLLPPPSWWGLLGLVETAQIPPQALHKAKEDVDIQKTKNAYELQSALRNFKSHQSQSRAEIDHSIT